MPLSQLENYQPHYLTLCCNMPNLGTDGIASPTDGIARFIAPVKCKVKSVAVGFLGVVVTPNGFRIDHAGGTIGDNENHRGMTMPATSNSFNGFLLSGIDDRNNVIEQGAMFRVRSNGGATGTVRANVIATVEPIGPVNYRGPLFVMSGSIPNGLAGQYRFPVPCGLEILQWWLGLSSTIAAQANNPTLIKNSATLVGTTGIQLAAGGADLTTFTQSYDDIQQDATDRFLPPEQMLQLNFTGAANFTTPLIYTILCRRS